MPRPISGCQGIDSPHMNRSRMEVRPNGDGELPCVRRFAESLGHGRSVAVLVIHFGTFMSQHDCARRQPVCPGSPCVRGATPTSRSLDAGFAPLPQWLDGVSDARAYGLRGSGTSWTLRSTTTPPPLRPYARAYAYRALRALASLSMARSVGPRWCLGESPYPHDAKPSWPLTASC
jgi:hypothetical protein